LIGKASLTALDSGKPHLVVEVGGKGHQLIESDSSERDPRIQPNPGLIEKSFPPER
jgi:hypothetical protein